MSHSETETSISLEEVQRITIEDNRAMYILGDFVQRQSYLDACLDNIAGSTDNVSKVAFARLFSSGFITVTDSALGIKKIKSTLLGTQTYEKWMVSRKPGQRL